jgi:hypothetical protein
LRASSIQNYRAISTNPRHPIAAPQGFLKVPLECEHVAASPPVNLLLPDHPSEKSGGVRIMRMGTIHRAHNAVLQQFSDGFYGTGMPP